MKPDAETSGATLHVQPIAGPRVRYRVRALLDGETVYETTASTAELPDACRHAFGSIFTGLAQAGRRQLGSSPDPLLALFRALLHSRHE
jgi:hypothetical protein